MGFNPADFRTETGRGEATADQVRHYLQDEEDHFLDSILQAFQCTLGARQGDEVLSSRFDEAVNKVIERIDRSLKGEATLLSKPELDIVVTHINAAFRHYEEILEGCATQLFAELEKMRVDEVGEDTLKSVEAVKDKLVGQITDCMQQVWRLQGKLARYRTKVKGQFFLLGWIRSYTRPVLDRGIVQKLRRIRKMVNQGYHQLKVRHVEYERLQKWATSKKEKLEAFEIFQTLSEGSRAKFADLYRLLKMLKRSESTSELIVRELNKLLGAVVQVEESVKIFEAYEYALKEAFYAFRRKVPQMLQKSESLKETRLEIAGEVQKHRKEVRVLGSMVFRYRDFILNTHPDPYVRARLGFREATVGPEPETTKTLVRLGHRVESLDKHYYGLTAAAEAYDPVNPPLLDLGYFDEIVEDLEETRLRARRPSDAQDRFHDVLEALDGAQEIYAFDLYRVMGIEKVMRLALRIDEHNVLVKEKRFLDLYETHLNIRLPIEDDVIRKQLSKLQKADLGSLEEWQLTANTLLDALAGFVQAERRSAPISFDRLVGEVRNKRFAVLEFLYAYRKLLRVLRDRKQSIPAGLNDLLEKINALEADFSYLVSHTERSDGPLKVHELRCIENL